MDCIHSCCVQAALPWSQKMHVIYLPRRASILAISLVLGNVYIEVSVTIQFKKFLVLAFLEEGWGRLQIRGKSTCFSYRLIGVRPPHFRQEV